MGRIGVVELLVIAPCCACSALSGLDDFEVREVDLGGAAGAGGSMGGALPSGGTGGTPDGGAGGEGGADTCGNGAVDANEECDDANTNAGDGCDACVVECPSGIQEPVTFHCYVYEGLLNAWDGAEAACTSLGPGWQLAAISSQSERGFLSGAGVLPTQAWLGARDPNNDDQFVWNNGEPWGYAPWYGNNPDDGVQCLTYAPSYGFVDRPCYESYPRVCELTPAGTP